MHREFDYTDLRILEGLGIYGPRNVTNVARNLGIPAETVRKRLKRLRSQIFLRTHVNVYHTNLGLRKAVVFAEAALGYEHLLFNSMKTNDFWIALARCYGMFEGCVGIYTIPRDHCAELERFLEEIKNLGLARNIQVFWSTCFQTVYSKCNWFDPESGTWNFQWDEWISEIPVQGTELPYTLVDPKDFPVKADEIDVFILKELEKDATKDFTNLAKMMGVSPQFVGYHYREHLLERGLIEGFDVSVFHFGRADSDVFFFIFNFGSIEKLAKFASSLLDKPFVRGLGKILGENSLFGYLYLPKPEFRRFIDSLSDLIRKGFLSDYQYLIQDLGKTSRQTIAYEHFKDGKWLYDHKKHIENLRNLVKNAVPTIQ